jgi:pimeloyl-ACP methyl ester carboxylesterase
MSARVLTAMFGVGSFSPEGAVRRGLKAATSARYRAEHPAEFDRIVANRLAFSPSLASYLRQAAAGARFDASGRVRSIDAPTLVIHGSEDRLVPVANARALARAVPRSRLRVLEGAGHLVFIEEAEKVNEEVTSFLLRGRGGSGGGAGHRHRGKAGGVAPAPARAPWALGGQAGRPADALVRDASAA